MRIYLVRHGESLATLNPHAFERADPRQVPVSQWGYEQAVAAGRYLSELYRTDPALKGRGLTLHHSPYRRIVQTTNGMIRGLAGEMPYTVQTEPLLEERWHGAFNGIVDEEKRRRIAPEVCEALDSPDPHVVYKTRMPGGESWQDVVSRTERFVDQRIRPHDPASDAVVVTHGGNFRALEMALVGRSVPWFMKMKPPHTGAIHLVSDEANGRMLKTVLFTNKQRSPMLPAEYKTAAYEGDGKSPLPGMSETGWAR